MAGSTQETELAADTLVLPKVVAFDLDGTLWLPEMDTLWGGAPFTPGKRPGEVIDSRGETVRLIGTSLEVLQHIATDPAWQGVEVAYVSRTTEVDTAEACLRAMEVVPGRSMFDLATHLEIFPGRKTTHFHNIQVRSRHVAMEEILFFDNERRNIIDCAPLGVTCIYCPDGITSKVWQKGLASFAAAQQPQQQGGKVAGGASQRHHSDHGVGRH